MTRCVQAFRVAVDVFRSMQPFARVGRSDERGTARSRFRPVRPGGGVSVPEGFDLEREGMMRNGRRTSFRVPIGPAMATGALLLLAAVNPGCSCEDDNQKQTTGSTSSGGGSGGTGGSGGGGTAGLALQQCHNDGAAFRSPFNSRSRSRPTAPPT